MKQKPIIIYVLTKLELGGAQKVCLQLARGASEQGAEVHLITGHEGVLVEYARTLGIQIHFLDSFKREIGFKNSTNEWHTWRRMVRIMRAIRRSSSAPVMVHTHSTKAGILGRWAAWFAGIPVRIHTIHGYGFTPEQSWLSWLLIYGVELLTALITTHFICVSQPDLKRGVRLFPRFKQRASIIRAAIEWDLFQPAQRIKDENKPIVIGTIACFKPQKNIIDLLQAFNAVYKKHTNVRLEIIGDGIQRPLIEQFIEKHQLQNVVTLHSWQQKVASFMAHWDIFALTSLWEGLPCSVVEARRMQLPVVAYATGGIPEVIEHNKNGLLYKRHEWQELADGLAMLIKQPEELRRLAHAQDNLTAFHHLNMMQNHQQLYSDLVKQ